MDFRVHTHCTRGRGELFVVKVGVMGVELPSLGIWRQAFRFHLTCWKDLLAVLPLMVLPFISDSLHAVLIHQKTQKGSLSPGPAVQHALRALPPVLAMKLSFELPGFLWAFIPIYGWVMSVRHRLYWSMASNVFVFEGCSGRTGRKRCRELIEALPPGKGVRTLVTIPSLFIALCLLVLATGLVLGEGSYVFWLCFVAILWITLPWSAAVNTFLYLDAQRGQ